MFRSQSDSVFLPHPDPVAEMPAKLGFECQDNKTRLILVMRKVIHPGKPVQAGAS